MTGVQTCALPIFWLRPGLKWHDGKPVTTADVKFTFDSIMHPDYDGVRSSSYKGVIEEMKIIDELTIDFKLAQISAPFLLNLTQGLIPKHVFEGVAQKDMRAHAFSRAPIGTGPYMFDRWVSGQYVELKANPYYHLGPVNIEKVIIRTYQDTKVMAAAWENKDIDWLAAIPTEDIDRVMKAFAGTSYFKEIPNHGYDYISINMSHPILADANVRMALTVGLDREAMVNTVLEKRGVVLESHTPATSWAHNPNIPVIDHSPTKAKQLLEAAGWKVPAGSKDGIRYKDGVRLSLKMMTNAGNTIRGDILSMSQAYYKRIGIEIIDDTVDWAVVLERLPKMEYELCVIGWSLGIDPDPYQLFHSSQAYDAEQGKCIGLNRNALRNAEIDKLIEAGRATMDLNERKAIYQKLDVLLQQEMPYVWLFQRTTVTAIHNRIQGVTWSPVGITWPETMYIKK